MVSVAKWTTLHRKEWFGVNPFHFDHKDQIKLRSHGLVVKADGSWPRCHGFKPRHCILIGCKQFAIYYTKEKLKIKVAKWGTPKKNI